MSFSSVVSLMQEKNYRQTEILTQRFCLKQMRPYSSTASLVSIFPKINNGQDFYTIILPIRL